MSNSKKRARLIPVSIRLIPAALISVIILALMSLFGLLDFNFGTSEGESQLNVAAQSDRTTASDEPVEESARSLTSEPVPAEESPALTAMPSGLVDVVVDGDSYQLAVGYRGETVVREPRTLAEIVDLARESSGDEAGIRARITRTFSATARADRELLDALQDAGLSADEIDHRRTLLQPE